MNNRSNRVTATLDGSAIDILRSMADKEPKRSMSAGAAELIMDSLMRKKLLDNERKLYDNQ